MSSATEMGCSSSKESPSNGPPRVVQKPGGGAGSAQVNNNGTASSPHSAQIGGPGNTSMSPGEIPTSPAQAVWPKAIRIPEMQVVVHIHHHQAPQKPTPCWTYISEGLFRVNQPEVVFTLLQRQNEHENGYPEGPVEWIRVVYELAKNRTNLETGQMCDLVFDSGAVQVRVNRRAFPQDPNKWATFRLFGALVHGIPIACSEFGIPANARPRTSHHVIALTHEEAAVARQFGLTRVIGHVGASVRWFPHPPWIDRDRADCITMADQVGTIRAEIPVTRIYGLNVMLVDNEIVFTIPEGDAKRRNFRKYVQDTPLNAVMAFDSFMTEEADGGLCWKRGQEVMGYAAHNKPTKSLNLCFITFASKQDDDTCMMVEDGYTLLIRDSTWGAIRDAIQTSSNLVVNLEDGMRFRLEWKKTVYRNPIDEASWHTSWKTYHPSDTVTAEPSNFHVKVSHLVLLIQPPEGHMDIKEFANYENAIERIVEDAIPVAPIPIPGSSQVGRQIIVEIEMPKCEGWLKMVAYPSMDGIALHEILPAIAKIAQPRVLSTVKFQVVFNLWGYQGDIENFQ